MKPLATKHLTAVILACAVLTQACSATGRRQPVPEELVDSALIPAAPFARMWGDEEPADIEARVALLASQTKQYADSAQRRRTYNLLAISGGGADGAFGAGLLKGWTESSKRPQFRIVTGVSTGALIAPFAFLGPDYDDEVERLYTSHSTRDIIRKRGPIRGLLSDAMADTEPLRERIDEIVDDQMIRDIAAEYAKGRRLLIGTTNLDARRPVIWNIGAIAAVGDEDSQELIEEVMLASASIPGFFPPVYIPVEADGEAYQEMHVDGGTTTQVFLYPLGLDLQAVAGRMGVEGARRRIYVIRNSMIEPRWARVDERVLPIAKASITALINSQGVGDLYRMYLQASQHGIDYNLAYIPTEFPVTPKEEFDPDYMRALFKVGYEMAREGYPWAKSPPGVEK